MDKFNYSFFVYFNNYKFFKNKNSAKNIILKLLLYTENIIFLKKKYLKNKRI